VNQVQTSKSFKQKKQPTKVKSDETNYSNIVLQSSPDTSASHPSSFAPSAESFKAYLASSCANTQLDLLDLDMSEYMDKTGTNDLLNNIDIDLNDLIKPNNVSDDLMDEEFLKFEVDQREYEEEEEVEVELDERGNKLMQLISTSTSVTSSSSSNKLNEVGLVNSPNEGEKLVNTLVQVQATNNQVDQFVHSIDMVASGSSLIENEEIVYEDSLQDESFDSDRYVLKIFFKVSKMSTIFFWPKI
jgi:hypothetical protein